MHSLAARQNLGQNSWQHTTGSPETLAFSGIGRAALCRKVGYDLKHQGDIGFVAHKAPLFFNRHKTAVHYSLEVKGKVGGGYAQLPRYVARHKAVRGVFDQQPEEIQAYLR